MASITKYFTETFPYCRIVSDSLANTWNGSAMQAHGSVSDYTADGVIVPTATAQGTGGIIKHVVEIPAALPDDAATAYRLFFFRATPAVNGEVNTDPDYCRFVWLDGAEVLPGEGGEGSGLTEAEVEAIVDAAIGELPASAIAATLTQSSIPEIPLTFEQSANRSEIMVFTDADGEAVDLDGKTIKLVLSSLLVATNVLEITCTVGGEDNNQVTIPVTTVHTATPGTFRYDLRNDTDSKILAVGSFQVRPCGARAA